MLEAWDSEGEIDVVEVEGSLVVGGDDIWSIHEVIFGLLS